MSLDEHLHRWIGRGRGPFGNAGPHNWLIFETLNQEWSRLARYLEHRLVLDVGCGSQPLRRSVESIGGRYLGLDHPSAGPRGVLPDVFASASALPFPSGTFGAVLSTTVLEHLEDPLRAMQEMSRVLVPGGFLVLSAPQYWHVHEEPRDFYRYTRFGLAHLASRSDLEVLQLTSLGNFWTTFMQQLAYWMNDRWSRRPLRWARTAIVQGAQIAGTLLSGIPDGGRYSWLNLMVARKPGGG